MECIHQGHDHKQSDPVNSHNRHNPRPNPAVAHHHAIDAINGQSNRNGHQNQNNETGGKVIIDNILVSSLLINDWVFKGEDNNECKDNVTNERDDRRIS